MTQTVAAIPQCVTLSDTLTLESTSSSTNWIIRDKESGEQLGQLSLPEKTDASLELFSGKGGFMSVLEFAQNGTVYFGLPGSETAVNGVTLTLDGERPSSAEIAVGEAPPVIDPEKVQTITPQAMILGAGLATRFERVSGQSTDYSKPAVPLLGRHSVISCLARHLAQHGFSRLFVNTYFKPESLKASLDECASLGTAPEKILYVDESKPSGTAGALRKLLTEKEYDGWLDTNKPLIIAQGDSVTDADFSQLMEAHAAQNALVTIGCQVVPDEDVSKFGIIVTDKSDADGQSGRITGFQEKPSLEEAKSRLGSTGFYIFSPKAFPLIREIYQEMLAESKEADVEFDFAKNVFSGLLARIQKDSSLGVFWAQQMECYWSDIGNPRQYISSVRDIYSGKVRVTMPSQPEQFYRDGVIYWDGAQKVADASGAKLIGNVVVAKRFRKA